MHRAPPPRRPLSHLGGGARAHGDRELVDVLLRAFEASASQPADTLTHGFHSYPARMHPALAYTVVRELSPAGGRVLDPFVGSGTVAIESMTAGRRAFGIDLNPLALRIAEVKCDVRDEPSLRRFVQTLELVAERSEERVRSRVDARAPIPPWEARYYAGHTLKELAGLREEILLVTDPRDRRALEVLLSAIVVKFSRQRADTSDQTLEKRIRKGLPTEFFVRKGRELVERWRALRAAVPNPPMLPTLIEGDARDAASLLPRGTHVDLVLSSPPYGGTYDYVAHHARRYPWLGLDASKFERREIGARRHLRDEEDRIRWDREVRAVLVAMRRSLAPRGLAVLLVGDAQIGPLRLDAAEHLDSLAEGAGLELVAAVAEPRPDFTGARDRREHLVALVPR